LLLLLICLTNVAQNGAAAAEEQVLFAFDDHSIPWRDNLKLTPVPPRKHPANPVLKPGPQDSVDGMGALLYGTVLKENGKFRMWYIAWPQPDKRYPQEQFYRPVAYAESTDGIHWDKPGLGLVDFRGSKANNIVLIQPADTEFARPYDYVSVIRDDADPDPARRYKMAYILYHRPLGFSTTATAVSADGLRWTLANTEPFTKGHFENTSLIRFQGTYYLTGQNIGRGGGYLPEGRDAGRIMTGFFSPNFKHWSGGRALNFFRSHAHPAPEGLGQELHMGAGLWNRGNVVLGLYGRWYGDTISADPAKKKITPVYGLKIDLGLVISNDAIHYREPVQNYIAVPRGAENDWDSEALLQAQAFHNTDSETLIWYSHWNTSNPYPVPPIPAKLEGKPMAIGLLTLRRDGFAYLSKQRTEINTARGMHRRDAEASILTHPITLPKGGRLHVNVDGLTPATPMRLTIVDDAEQPLPGAAPVALTENGVRVPVSADLPRNTPFRIRLEWPTGPADAKLYALYLTSPD
ncbi:MAG TPA: hypothetical protein VD994_20025, partial [Prosthecobacter sp.]|nr:hypothetical protein [Prosthecobacter sp.]